MGFRSWIRVFAAVCTMMLAGCSLTELDIDRVDVSATGIYSDGRIEELTVEPFDEEYYQTDEAADYISQILDEFNAQNPQPVTETNEDGTDASPPLAAELVSLKKTGDNARLDIIYRTYGLYNKFNNDNIRVMTMTQAVSSGLLSDFDELTDAAKGNAVAVDSVMSAQNVMLVKTVSAHHILTEGKILYYSGNVSVSGNNTADTPDEEAAVIVFKDQHSIK